MHLMGLFSHSVVYHLDSLQQKFFLSIDKRKLLNKNGYSLKHPVLPRKACLWKKIFSVLESLTCLNAFEGYKSLCSSGW